MLQPEAIGKRTDLLLITQTRVSPGHEIEP